MSKILLGWELGEGFGYCLQLRTIADALVEAGHQPVLALRSLEHAHRLFAERQYPVVQAPWITGRLTPAAQASGFAPTGFADLMACNGFGSVDHLYSMLRGWRDLIDQLRPELVVARYSPLLTLAAYGRLPAVVFGSAYLTPPADEAGFPHFRRDIPPYADQAVMLETARTVQRRFAAPQPDTLTEVYRGERRVVLDLPELDPYRAMRREPIAGIFEPVPEPTPVRGEGFHAYLAGDGRATRLAIESLLACGLPGQIFVRDSTAELRARVAGTPLRWLDAAPDAIAAAADSALVVHHGGIGTTCAALAAGRPQVLLPQVLDQWLTAGALDDSGHAQCVDESAPADFVADRIRRIATDPVARASALEAARSIHQRGLHGAWQQVVDSCLTLLH